MGEISRKQEGQQQSLNPNSLPDDVKSKSPTKPSLQPPSPPPPPIPPRRRL